jgi:hypothetical protein
MKAIALLSTLLLAPALHAQAALEYAEAKRLADRDEASLDARAGARLLESQRTLLEAGIVACATPDLDLSPLVVVMELDAGGTVVRTWLQGGSPLALCLRGHVAGKVLDAPRQAPFYASIELSFTP